MNLNSDKARWSILVIAGVLLTVLVYGQIADQIAEIEQSTPSVLVRWRPHGVVKSNTLIGNPASEYCINFKGTISIETDPNGAQYGVCTFAGGKQCEEWALMRGQCPVGGVDVKKYATPAGKYCAIRGGVYGVTKPGDVRTEVGTCIPAGSKESCDGTAYWFGKCPAN